MIPDPAPLPMPSLRTLGVAGLTAAGVLVLRWWRRRSQAAPSPSPKPAGKVLEARRVIEPRRQRVEVPWVDV